MIELQVYNKKSRLPEADYVLDKSEKFLTLLDVLTPKFDGNWEFILVEPKISEVKDLIDNDVVPDFVNCHVYMSTAKVETVMLDYPKLAPKRVSAKEEYTEMLGHLNHLIDKNAAYVLYDSMEHNLDKLRDALAQLDAECEGTTITTKQVKQTFVTMKRTYASDVIYAFFKRDKTRWFKYNALVKDLGERIAYYALYKQARNWLHDKDDYLQNRDVKNRHITDIDAPFICYVYTLFANSHDDRELYAIMASIDNRSQDTLERNQYVNLQ